MKMNKIINLKKKNGSEFAEQHPTEVFARSFHFELEYLEVLVFVEGRKSENPEKNSRRNARTVKINISVGVPTLK